MQMHPRVGPRQQHSLLRRARRRGLGLPRQLRGAVGAPPRPGLRHVVLTHGPPGSDPDRPRALTPPDGAPGRGRHRRTLGRRRPRGAGTSARVPAARPSPFDPGPGARPAAVASICACATEGAAGGGRGPGGAAALSAQAPPSHSQSSSRADGLGCHLGLSDVALVLRGFSSAAGWRYYGVAVTSPAPELAFRLSFSWSRPCRDEGAKSQVAQPGPWSQRSKCQHVRGCDALGKKMIGRAGRKE